MIRKFSLALVLCTTSLMAGAAVLEEVVVTAQKREQSIQDVGISISAFTGDQIHELGYTNAQQVTALAAGVSTVQPNGEANYSFAIRGASSSDFTSNNESPVAVYVDEVYISQMSGTGFMLFDLDRVELLRGPQGTLYGRNATGGLAHFITKKPSHEANGYGQVTLGEYDQVKFEGAIGGGITDTVSGRLSIATHNNDGYAKNRFLDQNLNNANDYAGRAQLLFEPNDDVSFLLNGRYSIQQIRTGFFENASAVVPGMRTPHVPEAPFLNGYLDEDGNPYAGDYDKEGHNDNETWGISGTLKWNLGNMTLTSITDYSSVNRDYIEDSDATPTTGFNFYLTTDAKQFSQELRLNGEAERTKWVTGLYYLNIDIADSNGGETTLFGDVFACFFGVLTCDDNLNVLASPPGYFAPGKPGFITLDNFGNFHFTPGSGDYRGFNNPYTINTESWSVFGQLEFELNEMWSAIVGFRWIQESKDYSYVNNIVEFPNDGTDERRHNPNILGTTQTFATSTSDGIWSARAQLNWRPQDDLLVYASWNRGTKASGFNAPFVPVFGDPAAVLTYKPEEMDAYEIGFKSEWFDGRARVNAAAYYYDYKDYQAFNLVRLDALTSNRPANMNGFEVELQATPTDGLDVLVGVAYNDAEIKFDGGFKTRPVQSPKWNISGLVRYEWPMFNGTMAIQGDVDFRDRTLFNLSGNLDTGSMPGYAVGNARLGYTTSDNKWEAAIFVNNIWDQSYRVQEFDLSGDPLIYANGFFGLVEEYYGKPRWVGGSIRFNWN